MQFPARSKQEAIVAEDDYQDWTSEDECGSNAAAVPAAVTAFAADIDAAITADLEGAALPKLTWSCPKDATWVTIGNTLRCCTADEVLLLLKSSDRAMHDLTSALSECEEEAGMAQPADAGCPLGNGNACIGEETHVLALRKWYDLKPGREFRCFVVDHCLVGECTPLH